MITKLKTEYNVLKHVKCSLWCFLNFYYKISISLHAVMLARYLNSLMLLSCLYDKKYYVKRHIYNIKNDFSFNATFDEKQSIRRAFESEN